MIFKAIGLMSGTSMDGIDVAFIESDGQTYVRALSHFECEYPQKLADELRNALTEALKFDDKESCFQHFSDLEQAITEAQIEAVKALMARENFSAKEVDLIGFHGQTILHRPDLGFTVQLGDGQKMAQSINIPVVYDFRTHDMTMGGEGAPLAPIYHQALSTKIEQYPLCFVNIGGVSNITYIEHEGAEPIAFDCGPGNALMDDWMLKNTNQTFDEDGKIARLGDADRAALKTLLSDEYFTRPAPKSLDRNHFAGERLDKVLESANLQNGAATLLEFTTSAIIKSVNLLPKPPKIWLICGGGRKNKALMQDLALKAGNGQVSAVDHFDMDGDFMEAEAFAYLAVRSKLGLPISFPKTTGCSEPVSGGVLVDR